MPAYRIYTPIGGTIRANSKYCYSGAPSHPGVQQGTKPYDIESPHSHQVWFRASGDIGSVIFQSLKDLICPCCPGKIVNDGVKARLFSRPGGQGCELGFVNYCHLKDIRVNFGIPYDNATPQGACGSDGMWVKEVGSIPEYDSTVSDWCYPVPHVHVSAKATGDGCTLEHRNWSCWTHVSGGRMWMYKFKCNCPVQCVGS